MNKIMWTVIVVCSLSLLYNFIAGSIDIAAMIGLGFILLIAIGYIVNLKK